jgi:hypothetical protein
MDWTTVATFISLEIASGFLKEHGKEIYHKAKGLLTPTELTTLGLLEQYPDSKKLQGEVANAFETHLKSNPDITNELNKLIKLLEKNRPVAKNVSNIENKDISNSLVINDLNQS